MMFLSFVIVIMIGFFFSPLNLPPRSTLFKRTITVPAPDSHLNYVCRTRIAKAYSSVSEYLCLYPL